MVNFIIIFLHMLGKITLSIYVIFCISGICHAEEKPGKVTIAAAGDIMLANRVEPYLIQHGPDYPYRNTRAIIQEADVFVANLEFPISNRGKAVEQKTFTFRASPLVIESLKQSGVRVVSLANNHAMDYGPLALQDTLTALTDNGILFTGGGMDLDDARSAATVKINNMTLAFLSYSLTFPLDFFASSRRPGTAPGYTDFIRADIEKIRPSADLVVVSFHWGAELMTTAKDYQIELGHQAIDWGADLVLGHHPHVLQELEIYKGRLIAYSLGNFVFGSQSNRTNTSIILLCTFQNKTLTRVEAVPLDVNNYRVEYQPRVLTGPEGTAVLQSINESSRRFKTELSISGNRGILTLPRAPGN